MFSASGRTITSASLVSELTWSPCAAASSAPTTKVAKKVQSGSGGLYSPSILQIHGCVIQVSRMTCRYCTSSELSVENMPMTILTPFLGPLNCLGSASFAVLWEEFVRSIRPSFAKRLHLSLKAEMLGTASASMMAPGPCAVLPVGRPRLLPGRSSSPKSLGSCVTCAKSPLAVLSTETSTTKQVARVNRREEFIRGSGKVSSRGE
mmetsp:Transcript_77648/g.206160  ORF Transcript_77648/g.206160 Transcript_77648/m.206160 type:complete len:206 (-) Transcript_77648:16-633(-)